MWGLLGWVVVIFFVGLLFNINLQLNFFVVSCFGLVFFILLVWLWVFLVLYVMQEVVLGGKVIFEDVLCLLMLLCFWVLVFFVIGICIYGVYDQQFLVYFLLQFVILQEGNEMYGYFNFFQVFFEVVGMFCVLWLVNCIGVKNGLIFVGMVMVMCMVVFGLVEGLLLIFIIKLLYVVELLILLVVIFKYNSFNFDKCFFFIFYLVGFVCISLIIVSVLLLLVGYSYEKYGFVQFYLIMGLLVFCIIFIFIFLLCFGKFFVDLLVL